MKTIPDPGFAGDQGIADPCLADALAAYGQNRSARVAERALLDVLARARLLVPVVALLAEEETGPGGLRREKVTDMAVPTILRPDGGRALPVFTSLPTMGRWRPDARPVPVECGRACLAAYAEQADAVVIDMAGPVTYVLRGAPMRAFAEGRPYLSPEQDPEVLDALRAALRAEIAVVAAYLEPGQTTDAVLALALDPGPSGGVPTDAVRRLAERLAADELLRERLGRGLDLAVLPVGTASTARPLYRR